MTYTVVLSTVHNSRNGYINTVYCTLFEYFDGAVCGIS